MEDTKRVPKMITNIYKCFSNVVVDNCCHEIRFIPNIIRTTHYWMVWIFHVFAVARYGKRRCW